jgi:hypothetical protein
MTNQRDAVEVTEAMVEAVAKAIFYTLEGDTMTGCGWRIGDPEATLVHADHEHRERFRRMARAALAVTETHRLAAEGAMLARVAELEAKVAMLNDRGAQAVIAYHAAICSPKGVVPVDDLYDQNIAVDMERRMSALRKTGGDA